MCFTTVRYGQSEASALLPVAENLGSTLQWLQPLCFSLADSVLVLPGGEEVFWCSEPCAVLFSPVFYHS